MSDGAPGHLLDRAGFYGGARGGDLLGREGWRCNLCLRFRFDGALELVTSGVEALVDPSLVGRVVATRARAAWWAFGKDRRGAGGGRRESGWGIFTPVL